MQRHARAADEGFEACVGGGPGTPPQCRAVSQLMRAAAANPRLRPPRWPRSKACRWRPRERIAQGYLAEAAPATFRVIVNPLVTWIWIGGLISLAGALIAIWPARGPAAARLPIPSWRR